MGVEIAGLEEMQAKLDKLAQQVREEIVVKAARDGGRVIAAAMSERAPERVEATPHSDALPRGAMKRDIGVKVKRDDAGFVRATIGPRRYGYAARWVEYGHRMVAGGYSKVLGDGKTRGAGKQIGEVPAYPFLRPAYEASVEEAMETFRSSMASGIQGVIR